MKIIITADLDDDGDSADPDDSTGLTDGTYAAVVDVLAQHGFHDIEIQAHDS